MKNSETRVDLSAKSDEVPTYLPTAVKKKMKKFVQCSFTTAFARTISVFKNEILTLEQILSFWVDYLQVINRNLLHPIYSITNNIDYFKHIPIIQT